MPTLVKGLHLDIGALPQFMDCRPWPRRILPRPLRCAALCRVDRCPCLVFGMCHNIGGSNVDATAPSSNPRADASYPLQRHNIRQCIAVTVTLGEVRQVVECIIVLQLVLETNSASWKLAAVNCSDEVLADYSGPLLSNLDFWSVLALCPNADGQRSVPADAPAVFVVCARSVCFRTLGPTPNSQFRSAPAN